MEEHTMSFNDPEETFLDLDPAVIDEDWNSAPDDKLGAEAYQENAEAADEDEPVDGGRGKSDGGDGSGTAVSGGSDQSFALKHLSEIKTVGRDEVITLAQKGLDYDRIRGKLDAASAELSRTDDAYAVFRELASAQGVTAEQLIDATRAQLLAQKHGLEPSDAARRVAAQRAEKERTSPRADPSAQKRQTEIREFLTEYGTGIDPKAIPQEVWQSVAKGRTLLSAYQAWELKKLRSESTAAKKATENKSRSAGSRFSSGSVRGRDRIADDWYDN